MKKEVRCIKTKELILEFESFPSGAIVYWFYPHLLTNEIQSEFGLADCGEMPLNEYLVLAEKIRRSKFAKYIKCTIYK